MNWLALILMATTFVACKKNVDDEMIHQNGEIFEEQFLVNPEFVRWFLDNAYNHLQNRYDVDLDGAMLAAATDEAVNSNLNSGINIFTNGTWSPVRTFDDAYDNYYSGIRKTNLFLKLIDGATVKPLNSSIDRDSTIKRMKGEAYFLRAFYHFELFKRYGPIVLITEVLDRNDNLDRPRNTLEACISQIATDCDAATAGLPTWNPDHLGELGRATKVAAMALKSRLLLYAASPLYNPDGDVAKWRAAADAALAVIQMDRASLHPKYEDIFNYSVAAYNNEVIFATKADNTNAIEINQAPISYDGARGRTNPTQELVDAFETLDGRMIDDPLSSYDENNPYENRDPRFAKSILYNGAVFKNTPVQTYPNGKDGLGANINATKTGYYLRKFLSENASWNTVSNAMVRRPWVLLRYAEVLLNYAEALNEAEGPVAAVYTFINQVRQRPGVDMPPLQSDDPNGPGYVAPTQEALRMRIQHERRVELCFEEHRFFDVRRWMLGEAVFGRPVSGVRIQVDAGNGMSHYERFVVQNRYFDQKNYFYPFPQSQVDLQPSLVQNPGW